MNFATLIAPDVKKSSRVSIGEGTVICSRTIITVDVLIGKHCSVNLNCTIGHDCVIRDFVTMYPNANVSGSCEIGECVELGTGSQIIQGKRIAPNIIVGAGAVVTKDLEKSGTYVGVPTRRIR